MCIDLFSQEKLLRSKCESEINSVTGRLHKSEAELEHLRLQLSLRQDQGEEAAKEEQEDLRRRCQHLESQLKVCKSCQVWDQIIQLCERHA